MKLKIAATALLLLASANAVADTYSCNISVASVSFGRYERANTTTGTGTVTVDCTLISGTGEEGVPYQIALSPDPSGSFGARHLATDTGDILEYNLYTDSGYTTVWGDGSAGTGLISGLLSGPSVNLNIPIFGRIPAGQNTRKGTFVDPGVQATITY